jgi:hypothetical protein
MLPEAAANELGRRQMLSGSSSSMVEVTDEFSIVDFERDMASRVFCVEILPLT